MTQVNVLEAKNNLSSLLRLVESGDEDSVVIARRGTPVARIVAYAPVDVSRRIGVAKGKMCVPDDIDWCNDEIERLFYGGDDDENLA